MSFLTVENVSKQEGGFTALKNINLVQQRLQKIAIAGETGSGKTTLLKIIAGLIQPSSGSVYVNAERVEGPDEKLIPGHPGIAYLSQHFELRNNYRVEEELECKNLLSEEDAQRLYRVCQIEHLLKRKTTKLSGGERQRIVLARLLTTSPSLLLLDEPFSNLDMPHKQVIKSVIEDIGQQLGITCIMVSHDPSDTLHWADRILIMKDGEIVQQGSPIEVYQQPNSEYCAGLLGEYNVLSSATLKWLLSAQTNLKEIVIVRPEDILINQQPESTRVGRIEKLFFMGGHSFADIITPHQKIRVRINTYDYIPNQQVTLSLIDRKKN
jgi:ABC-type sugar transport system ATPase subunit